MQFKIQFSFPQPFTLNSPKDTPQDHSLNRAYCSLIGFLGDQDLEACVATGPTSILQSVLVLCTYYNDITWQRLSAALLKLFLLSLRVIMPPRICLGKNMLVNSPSGRLPSPIL
jgi:hypothetical protein